VFGARNKIKENRGNARDVRDKITENRGNAKKELW
jgi:hypothetical protein